MNAIKLNVGQAGISHQSPGTLRRVTESLAGWLARGRQRNELAHADELMRRDLGLSEADVWRETRKAPWSS
jgi:uncharacterized protein YjiS (DUF1127 family)